MKKVNILSTGAENPGKLNEGGGKKPFEMTTEKGGEVKPVLEPCEWESGEKPTLGEKNDYSRRGAWE